MFAVEAKKRYDETVGRPSKQSVGNRPPNNKAKARDLAAEVVGVSPSMVVAVKCGFQQAPMVA